MRSIKLNAVIKRFSFQLVILSLIFSNLFISCKKEDKDSPAIQVIKVAALLPKTGSLSNLGTTSELALTIGANEINDDFTARGLPYRIELMIIDTQLDTNIALSSVQNLVAEGYKMFIGPFTSSELKTIKSFADSSGIVVVSPSSTASSLVIDNDAIFRYCPGEQAISTALATSIFNSGKQAVVTFSRNDIATVGLQSTFQNLFTGLGGTVVTAGTYPVSTTDFTATINDVRNQIVALSGTFSRSQIGVYYPSFNEAIGFFHQAATDTILSSVNWYGSVGFIKAPGLLTDTLAAEFALTTHYFSPEPALPSSAQSLWQPLKSSIQSQTGIEPDFYAIAVYDILHVMAKLAENNMGVIAAGSMLQSEFFTLSNQSSGATGVISLNAAGDRSNGIFNYWGIAENNGVYSWIITGQSQ